MRKIKTLSIALITFYANLVASETVTGKLYKLDSKRQELLYVFQNKISDQDRIRSAHSEYASLDNKVIVSESSVIKDGRPQLYEISQHQTGKQGKIEVKDGIVYFVRTENNNIKTETEKLTDNFVFPHSLVLFMQSKWDELQSGKEIKIRMAVWDRLETVGMSLQKIGEGEAEGKKSIKIRMKPTSFIIAALVDPLTFSLSQDTRELLEMQGRVPPKLKSGESWKDLDADVVYVSDKK